MATRNVTIDLADWTLLSALIAAQDINLSKLTNCQKLEIISPDSNADGTKVQITSDFVNEDIGYSLLKEEGAAFESPLRSNNISTIDKKLRIVDAANVVTAGTARVILNFA